MKTFFTYSEKTRQLLLLLAVFIWGGFNNSSAQTKYIIEASNTVFTPDDLEIVVGDTVEWRNIEGFHNVNGTQSAYPENPEYFGNDTGSGWTYSYVFNTAGHYDYHCDPHVGLGMTGEVRVKEREDEDNHLLVINFSNMDPHNNQMLYLRVYEKNTGKEIERKTEDISVNFADTISGIEIGRSYYIDFFADFNENGMYDAPGTDHAWRLELNDVTGDATLDFVHNTNFTDIMWPNMLTVHFTGMTPHVGQDLWLAVVDKNSGMEVDRIHAVVEEDFMVHAYGIKPGMSYNVDFFADFNENGMYDAPGTDHAWRLELNDVTGDATLDFVHNTNFTDIMWQNRLTMHFTGMTPHAGQDLWLAVIDKNSGTEVDRVHAVVEEDFMVHAYGIEPGMSYNVDFFADFNENGMYDAPGTDHAWRLELDNVTGDTTLMFAHNTNFTDIMWKHQLTLQFIGMTPHLEQMLKLYVVNTSDGMIKDSVTIDQISDAAFEINSNSLMSGESYHINFYADFNQNGTYDAPPTDHAWQIMLDDVAGDTTLMFTHNTGFTDIFNLTSISDDVLGRFNLYPNPAKEKVWIDSEKGFYLHLDITLYDITGRPQNVEFNNLNNRIELNVSTLKDGIYIVELKNADSRKLIKLIKQ